MFLLLAAGALALTATVIERVGENPPTETCDVAVARTQFSGGLLALAAGLLFVQFGLEVRRAVMRRATPASAVAFGGSAILGIFLIALLFLGLMSGTYCLFG